jgi:hypothetical protein
MKKILLSACSILFFLFFSLSAEEPGNGCSLSDDCMTGTYEGVNLSDPVWSNDYNQEECSNDCKANGSQCCYTPKYRHAPNPE